MGGLSSFLQKAERKWLLNQWLRHYQIILCLAIVYLRQLWKNWRVRYHNSGGVHGEVHEACTGKHGTKYVWLRMKDVWGFKDITDFNTAMLGKQLWRLIEWPNTLFSRVFKGRYFSWNRSVHILHHMAGGVLFRLDLW